MIHIGRAGVKLGSFSEFEVSRGLASGKFLLTDLGWKEGMENWTPLSEFSEFAPTPPPLPPLPDETSDRNQEFPAETGQVAGLPWDHRKEIGFFPAFGETVWLVLFNPGEAFSRMRASGSLTDPFLYNLIGGWLGAVACGIYLVVTSRMPQPPDLTGARALFTLTPAMAIRELKILVIMGPVIVTVSTLVLSVIAHLYLMIAGGANRDFWVTLRVFCFSYGSAQLLQIIPFCGNLLAPMWMMVCCVIGLSMAHNTSTSRSVTAMALFLFTCFLCCAGALFIAVGSDPNALRSILNQ